MSAMGHLIAKVLSTAIALLLVAGCTGHRIVPDVQVVESSGALQNNFCTPQQGVPSVYRKKVAVLATELLTPQNANDLPGLSVAWSERLQQRLGESGHLLVTSASGQRLHSGERQQEWIVSLAKRLEVQFIVVVRFQNLHAVRNQFGVGNYAVASRWMKRQIDAELMIFDGVYGHQIASINHGALAEGSESEVFNTARIPLLRGPFLDTPLGSALAAILNAEVESGLKQLACLPMVARVAKIVGDNIYMNTNVTALVRPGDTLQLFRLSGQTERHLGAVEILKVFPESAVGIYKGEGGIPTFSEGLRVREW